jgi:hypothetical protein
MVFDDVEQDNVNFIFYFEYAQKTQMRRILIGLLFLQACGSEVDVKPEHQKTLVGSDRSAEGCIGSAGYVWSVVRDSCIRPFEEGSPFFAYNPATGAVDSTSAIYFVLSTPAGRAELFFGPTEKPAIMDALKTMEGETMPVLYESKTELVKLRYYRDSYQILYQDSIRYIQFAGAPKGLRFPTH